MNSSRPDRWWEPERRPAWHWLPAVAIPAGVLLVTILKLWGG